MADDQVTAELARIRAELRTFGASDDDTSRLLAAVEAVLILADEWERDAAELDRDVARARRSHYASDHAQADTDKALAGELRTCAADVREVITRALTGAQPGAQSGASTEEEAGDG